VAKIEELARQISDTKLRDEIAAEIKELKKQKRFGLVFEEHLPEMLRLPKAKIRLGNLVAHRDAPGSEVWRVIGINSKKAKCRQPVTPGKYDQEIIKEFPLEELVLVVSFGEPIYPILTPIDRVERGGPDKPWQVLINADNYHALQLLLYAHERKVDLIYIDPPYNTGARDWKYNNDYVDRTDAWRHSKWLSMMKKRLALAKRLLKADGILVVTIDDNEVHHLLTLTEELFRE
jgi:adenine-specific DNA-methyltransferase